MVDIGTLNFRWSQVMIAGFCAAGVRHAVISPGSRSTPLALAMLRQAGMTCEIVIDERSAAFLALGIAKSSRRPVILLATSGTAPANWFPAVIEANQSNVPLILLSADRPPELQDCGANQTINQTNLFGSQVRASHLIGLPEDNFNPNYLYRLAAQAYEQSCWPLPGPVHINQAFREPLLPSAELPSLTLPKKIQITRSSVSATAIDLSELAQQISGKPGFIICGELPENSVFATAVTELAAKLGCPIFAEPLSGLRFGEHDQHHLLVRYNHWLSKADQIDFPEAAWIIRFGAFPVTRHLQNLISEEVPIHVLVEPHPGWIDPANQLTEIIRADPVSACQALLNTVTGPCPDELMATYRRYEMDSKIASQTANQTISTAWHIRPMIEAANIGTTFFIGNSLAIRNLDSDSGSGTKQLRFYGNRGASGIDGNIATAVGLAITHGQVIALVGDLTAQHDLGSLALAQGRDIVLVVINNAGGGIFDYLPQASLPEFELAWRTPQKINFKHAALTFGLEYAQCDSATQLSEALTQAQTAGGPHLIEVLVGR